MLKKYQRVNKRQSQLCLTSKASTKWLQKQKFKKFEIFFTKLNLVLLKIKKNYSKKNILNKKKIIQKK